mgnify:CR=1 FL=1
MTKIIKLELYALLYVNISLLSVLKKQYTYVIINMRKHLKNKNLTKTHQTTHILANKFASELRIFIHLYATLFLVYDFDFRQRLH